jgi:ATP-dependent Clp protease adaptor protein ClpS
MRLSIRLSLSSRSPLSWKASGSGAFCRERGGPATPAEAGRIRRFADGGFSRRGSTQYLEGGKRGSDRLEMSGIEKRGGDENPNTGVVVKAKPKTKKPSMYKVLMLNDDYTPMEFVVHILERFFSKTRDEATRIMLHVHRRGVGICGVFTYEVAETKVTQVMDFARQHQHPLQCTLEKE